MSFTQQQQYSDGRMNIVVRATENRHYRGNNAENRQHMPSGNTPPTSNESTRKMFSGNSPRLTNNEKRQFGYNNPQMSIEKVPPRANERTDQAVLDDGSHYGKIPPRTTDRIDQPGLNEGLHYKNVPPRTTERIHQPGLDERSHYEKVPTRTIDRIDQPVLDEGSQYRYGYPPWTHEQQFNDDRMRIVVTARENRHDVRKHAENVQHITSGSTFQTSDSVRAKEKGHHPGNNAENSKQMPSGNTPPTSNESMRKKLSGTAGRLPNNETQQCEYNKPEISIQKVPQKPDETIAEHVVDERSHGRYDERPSTSIVMENSTEVGPTSTSRARRRHRLTTSAQSYESSRYQQQTNESSRYQQQTNESQNLTERTPTDAAITVRNVRREEDQWPRRSQKPKRKRSQSKKRKRSRTPARSQSNVQLDNIAPCFVMCQYCTLTQMASYFDKSKQKKETPQNN